MGRRKIGPHPHDPSAGHRHVHLPFAMIGGIDHVAVLEQKIVNLLGRLSGLSREPGTR